MNDGPNLETLCDCPDYQHEIQVEKAVMLLAYLHGMSLPQIAWKFCSYCGKSLTTASRPITDAETAQLKAARQKAADLAGQVNALSAELQQLHAEHARLSALNSELNERGYDDRMLLLDGNGARPRYEVGVDDALADDEHVRSGVDR